MNARASIRYIQGIALVAAFAALAIARDPESNPPRGSDERETVAMWGKQVRGVKLSVTSTDRGNRFTAADSVWIFASTKNFGSNPVQVMVANALYVYTFDVVGPNKRPVRKTVYGEQRVDAAGENGERTTKTLGNGQLVTDPFHLSRIFDMSVAGDYEIKVSRKIWSPTDAKDSWIVESNTLKVKVVNPDRAPIKEDTIKTRDGSK